MRRILETELRDILAGVYQVYRKNWRAPTEAWHKALSGINERTKGVQVELAPGQRSINYMIPTDKSMTWGEAPKSRELNVGTAEFHAWRWGNNREFFIAYAQEIDTLFVAVID